MDAGVALAQWFGQETMRLYSILHTSRKQSQKEELIAYNISHDKIPQLMTTIASMSVFPFAARGIFEGIFEKMDIDFNDYLEERKKFAADFVIKAIKNQGMAE